MILPCVHETLGSITSTEPSLDQYFSTFPMLGPFNTVPPVMVTPPNPKIFSLLLCNCDFATVMNCKVNTPDMQAI